jgi:hypothetical protein
MEAGALVRSTIEVACEHGGSKLVEILDNEGFDLFSQAGSEI